jgi:hypothetical protein
MRVSPEKCSVNVLGRCTILIYRVTSPRRRFCEKSMLWGVIKRGMVEVACDEGGGGGGGAVTSG